MAPLSIQQEQQLEQYMWYKQPAAVWEEALPVGNGKLGAMVFGHPKQERIALNEDSVWYGGPRDRNNTDARAHLTKIRQLLQEGKPQEAQQLSVLALSGVPETQRHYMPLGDLELAFQYDEDELSNYTRNLNLQDGIAQVSYEMGKAVYQRETFASFPDQAIITRITSSSPGGLSFTARLTRGRNRYFDEIVKVGSDTIVMRGNCGGAGGSDFRAALRAAAEGGTVSVIGEHLIVDKADSVTLLLTAATTFRHADPEAYVVQIASAAATQAYEQLRQRHLNDFRSLSQRVGLHLQGDPVVRNEPTDIRLERVRSGAEDIGLTALYYHYGRYLLISSSRPGSLPANLQGIWNEHMLPPWDSKYTININAQMNYWIAESGNLAECHKPLFELIDRMREPGRRTAEVMYGCKGFVAHHNTDIWADTAPQDLYLPATYWQMGAAWLCLHLWEHYEYGLDAAFLEGIYPTLKEAAEFFVDFLTETTDGLMVTSPSVSPENTYILPNGQSGTLCIGPSMDSQILYELFSACEQAAAILEVDAEWRSTWSHIRGKLPKPAVGSHGQIQEWMEDYEEAEPGHRHISQLFALHPGKQFTVRGTPELAQASRATLERRLSHGGGHTGWSRAWIINFWARLEDGEKANDNIQALLKHSTLPNLLDNHPPFQIDGNFGGAAGISEMLVQSHTGELHLLPALPVSWSDGEITGLRARGGLEVSIRWSEGKLVEASIQALVDQQIVIRAGCSVQVTAEGSVIAVSNIGEGIIGLKASRGTIYKLEVR